MVQRIVFPSATQFLIDYLATVTTAPVVGLGIPTAKRFVKITRAGGLSDLDLADVAQLLVEIYDSWPDAAELFALDIRSHIRSLEGRTVLGVNVKRVVEYGGIANLPDPRTPDLARFTFTIALYLRGNPTE
jgi:hypothetical protein